MDFVRAWLTPRIAFWVMWTGWLWALRDALQDRVAALGPWTMLILIGPPILVTWIGSRFVRNPFDTPSQLFWKGTAASCVLGLFANIFILKQPAVGFEILMIAFLICAILGVRGSGGSKRIEMRQGDLFTRVQFIARQAGVNVHRVVVFTSARNSANAFAHRLGSILLSDRLLRILSRPETDAVIAHEASHLRPRQTVFVTVVPLLIAVAIVLNTFWPSLTNSAPFWPFLGVLVWRALRRRQEFEADAASVRLLHDPEALITALTRVSIAGGMPLHWGRLAGFFISHPPMSARFRCIARAGGMNPARIEELVNLARTVPSLPGYASPFDNAPEHGNVNELLSTHIKRLTRRLSVVGAGLPIGAGLGIAALERFARQDSVGSLTLVVLWTFAVFVCYWILYEVCVGSERRRLRNQLPCADQPGSYFAGLASGVEPRTFDGSYHYDLGLVRLDGPLLHFNGARCAFSIGRAQVRRIWIGDGPRHWTPRKKVCLEYQASDDSAVAVISLQPFESWFWPATTADARRSVRALTEWQQGSGGEAAAPVPPPEMAGTPLQPARLAKFWKPIRLACGISFAGGWIIGSMAMFERVGPDALSVFAPSGLIGALAAPLVTFLVILFGLAPQLDFRRRVQPPTLNPTSPRPSAL